MSACLLVCVLVASCCVPVVQLMGGCGVLYPVRKNKLQFSEIWSTVKIHDPPTN